MTLSDKELEEIEERAKRTADACNSIDCSVDFVLKEKGWDGWDLVDVAHVDVPKLIEEVRRLRAERPDNCAECGWTKETINNCKRVEALEQEVKELKNKTITINEEGPGNTYRRLHTQPLGHQDIIKVPGYMIIIEQKKEEGDNK